MTVKYVSLWRIAGVSTLELAVSATAVTAVDTASTADTAVARVDLCGSQTAKPIPIYLECPDREASFTGLRRVGRPAESTGRGKYVSSSLAARLNREHQNMFFPLARQRRVLV